MSQTRKQRNSRRFQRQKNVNDGAWEIRLVVLREKRLGGRRKWGGCPEHAGHGVLD